jgi:hypothetical protein
MRAVEAGMGPEQMRRPTSSRDQLILRIVDRMRAMPVLRSLFLFPEGTGG